MTIRYLLVGLLVAWIATGAVSLTSLFAQTPSSSGKEADGERHEEYQRLQEAAKAAHQRGDVKSALSHARAALLLEADLFGLVSPQRAESLELFAQWLMDEQKYGDARLARQGVRDICRELYGADHWRTGDATRALGDVDTYEKFTDAQRQALHDVEARHLEVLTCYAAGEYRKAVDLAQTNVSVYAELMGREHSNYSALLNNLAAMQIELANFAVAEQLLEQSLAIDRRLLGDRHPGVAAGYHNLGRFCYDTGDYARAEEALRSSLRIKEQLFGVASTEYADTLHSLAVTLFRSGHRMEAAKLLDQCLDISRRRNDQSEIEDATLIGNLARLYLELGQRKQAVELYQRCAALRRKQFGGGDPRYAAALINLAGVYQSEGEYAAAMELLEKSHRITTATLGPAHPQLAEVMVGMGEVAANLNDYPLARSHLRGALEIVIRLLHFASRSQAERQELAMRVLFREYLDRYVALALRFPEAADDAYHFLLLWKGSALARNRDLRLLAARPELKDIYASLQANASRLSALATTSAAIDPALAGQALSDLTERQEELERQLSLASFELRQESQPIRAGDLVKLVPDEVVLIDLIECEDFLEREVQGEIRVSPGRILVGFVVTGGGPIRMVRLAKVEDVAEHVRNWRAGFGEGRAAEEAARWLKIHVWDPLAIDSAQFKTVLISPDGVLSYLPFNALPGEAPDSYLIEQFHIAVVPVPRLLLQHSLDAATGSPSPDFDMLIMGGIDYDRQVEIQPARPSTRMASNLFADDRGFERSWKALPGAEAEIIVIKDVVISQLEGARIVERRGGAATEDAFCKFAPRARILHVATHGFFAGCLTDGQAAKDLEPQAELFRQSSFAGITYNVGIMSGLVFAGANNPPKFPSDLSQLPDLPADGVLTAEEAALLSLGGVRLAVLSACETGLGHIVSGEGLLGMQRSFQMAGAKSTIASLWKVNDSATRRIMEQFYRNCIERELSPLDALREAQLDALKNPDLVPRGLGRTEKNESFVISRQRLAPRYWAAFVFSGDWR